MFRRVLAASALSLLGTGCVASAASSTAGSGVSLTAPPAAPARVPSSPRVWSAADPLTWAEYLAAPPAAGLEGARTVYVLTYESRCHGTVFTFDVTAVFVPDQSWVKADVLASPRERERVLQHERTHFDLTEVYARRMRQYFVELYNACALSDDEVSAAVDRFVREEAEAQRKYDEESGYGLEPARQRAWNEHVASLLTALAPFARPVQP